jgi:NTE family protein
MKILKGLLFTIVVFSALSVFAQKPRPKVGLVLSGGGAKGMSHIGILRAIDSAGLKIDYVTGTSMGSIMGGMYAVGYSGKQIDSVSSTLDWDILLSNKPSFKDISLDEKDEYGKYAVEVGVRDFKPQIGTGLIESEELWLKLSDVFYPVWDIKDFSKFDIPFKCLATDLATGEAVVHEKGEITKALRSSMAIPSVFSAIDHDSTKLVDGGIIRNFPVTDVKEMGADIVIGVNLFSGLTKLEDLNTALDIMYQITQYRDAEDLVKEKKFCDILIEPPLGEYSAGSFSASDTIKEIGYEMGRIYYPYFKKLADSLNAIANVPYDPETRLKPKEPVRIDAVNISGIQKTSKNMLVHNLNIVPGNEYTAQQLNSGFRKAYSTRYYNKVIYTLAPTDTNAAILNCELRENPLTSLKLALSYHSFLGAGIIVNLTQRNLLFDKSRTMVKVLLGDNFRGMVQHKQAMGRRLNYFATLSFLYEMLPLPIYDRHNLSDQNYLYQANTSSIDLNIKRVFGTDKSLGFGIAYYNTNLNPNITATASVDGTFNSYYSYLEFDMNTTDRRMFPRSGVDFSVEAGLYFARDFRVNYIVNDSAVDKTALLSEKPVERIRIGLAKYSKLGSRFSLIQAFGLGIQKFENQNFPIDMFMIGGVQNLVRNQFVFPGLREGQVLTSSFTGIVIGVQCRVVSELYLIPKISGAFYDFTTLNKWVDTQAGKGVLGSSLTLGYNLSSMPMEFTVMYSPQVDVVYSHVKIGFLF